MKKIVAKENKLVIYQSKSGSLELRGDLDHETLWATQAEIAQLFDVTPQNITLHITNIFKDKELLQKATCKESLQVQVEGKRQVKRSIKLYNLDVIIAVGYRISSVMGTNFRIWATKTLKQHLTKGYTINPKMVRKNYEAFLKSVSDIQAVLPEHVTLDPKSILELVKEFASTWTSLDAYDKESLTSIGITKKSIKLSGEHLSNAIATLRTELIGKDQATEIFAQERSRGSIEGIVGNVMQSFGGKDVYKTVEEKASHLLYFMVKNHPFVDGNKRSGAFAFIWFLRKVGSKNAHAINSISLTVLTLLIAESSPTKKDQMIGLVTTLLSSKK